MRFQMHQLKIPLIWRISLPMRRNIALEDVPSAKDQNMSRWTISNDDEPQIRENNSFLYDNVD